MARGFVAGAIWGLVAAVAGAGAVSLAVGPPKVTGTPGTAPVEVTVLPADPGGAVAPDAAPTTTPQSDTVVSPAPLPETPSDSPPVRYEEGETPEVAVTAPPDPARRPGAETNVVAPEADALAPLTAAPDATPDDTATQTAAMPDPALDSGALPAPEATAPASGVDVATDAPVLPTIQAARPPAPGAEEALSIATEPAQPPLPQVPAEDSGLVADTDAATDSTADMAQAASESDSESDSAAAPATPDPQPLPQVEAEAQMPRDDSPEVAVADPEMPAPDADMGDAAPGPAAESDVRILTPSASAPEAEADASETVRPAIGTPGVSLVDRSAVPQGRLPTIGAPAPSETPDAAATSTSPLIAFAASVDVAADVPRLSIVLIDEGKGPLGPDTLDAFPFPVTFALDPSAPGAEARMQAYRDQGFEVMAMAGVPDGATPSDVEVTLASVLGSLPQVVAVMERPDLGLQGSRAISDQVAQALRATGHGLVLLPKGLNTATALASREGVPAASVFKDFDGAGQDPRAIRRFLDGAAFRARQEGAVIVLGRLKADTLSALLLWGLQDRASQVALVPVSLVLREAAGL